MTVEKLLEGCEHDGSFIPVGKVKRLMKEYARIKCLEAIENTKQKSTEVILEYYRRVDTGDGEYDVIDLEWVTRDIQNIPNQDVMPEL